jgi:hypothetical protein
MGIEGLRLTDTSESLDSPLRPSQNTNTTLLPQGEHLDKSVTQQHSQGTISLLNTQDHAATSLEKSMMSCNN